MGSWIYDSAVWGDVWATELNFGVVNLELASETTKLNEITQGVSVHRDVKRSENDIRGAQEGAARARGGETRGWCLRGQLRKPSKNEAEINHQIKTADRLSQIC